MVAVDGYLPIYNPVVDSHCGEIRVLLAMGTQSQVMALSALKTISAATGNPTDKRETTEHGTIGHGVRPSRSNQ